MQKPAITIIVSTLFFAIVGPIVVLVGMFFSKLALQGVAEPQVFLLYPVAMLFGAGFAAGSVGLGYGILLAISLCLPPIDRRIKSTAHLIALGICVALIYSISIGMKMALEEQRKTDAIYVGKLERSKPENGLWKNFTYEGRVFLLLIPTLVCGIAVPFLLSNTLLKRDAPEAARPLA